MSKKGEKVKERADKPTAVESEYRVSQVYTWILNGASYKQIVRQCAELWGIRERASENLISKARAEIGKVSQEERDNALGLALNRLNDLYMVSKMNSDIKTCLAVQKEISELYGLKNEQKVTLNTTVYLKENDLKML